MKRLIDQISSLVEEAFGAAGYNPKYGKVTVSNRPDLGDYQCNGAMPAAKEAHKAPFVIAEEVKNNLASCAAFSSVEAVKPGFLNFRISDEYLSEYLNSMRLADRFGLELDPSPKKIVIDYGGPNVAKPLHVGHLRSAIIGESIKRIDRFFGNEVIGDVHLGDWGLQMGLIIALLQERQPGLPYFDPAFEGSYPSEAPFTISDLEKIYPEASARSKVDPGFAEKAHAATYALQRKEPGYYALWQHIMRLSVADLKRNYSNLNVSFDVWYGESDADAYIPAMLNELTEKGILTDSDGAKVIEVSLPDDKKEVPPCIVIKSDGATLYATTDLATLIQREALFRPDKVVYVVDKRQSLHFEQVFRAARKAGIVRPETELEHIGFGTMNGRDGKPFKTREGGVMRLEQLISDINSFVRAKVEENHIVGEADVAATSSKIAMAALKYGDLSNQASKDYVFDLDRFASFEGNTGPYILYTIVRIKSILARAGEYHAAIVTPSTQIEKDLMLTVSRFGDNMLAAYRESAPNLICAYVYELCCQANRFYHDTMILSEQDADKRSGYLSLIALARDILLQCIDLLGFDAPEKM